MTRIIDSSKIERIRDTSNTGNKVSANFIMSRFGARQVATNNGQDLLQVRDMLQQMVSSKGGRPSLTNSSDRVKVPKLDEDWKTIGNITKRLGSELVFKPSQAQVAAVMLHWAVTKMSVDDIKEAMTQ